MAVISFARHVRRDPVGQEVKLSKMYLMVYLFDNGDFKDAIVSANEEPGQPQDVAIRGHGLWKELPMPKGSEHYTPWSQQILREARLGRIVVSAQNYSRSGFGRSARDDDKENDMDNVGDGIGEDRRAKATGQGFMAKRWLQVPKHLEEPEVEHLAKKRRGLSSMHVTSESVVAPVVNVSTLRKSRVRRVDEQGRTNMWEVLVPEGHAVEGEVDEPGMAENLGISISRPTPGTVIGGLGVANDDGVIVVSATNVPAVSVVSTPVRPRGPRRKTRGGFRRGRGKKLGYVERGGVSASAEALFASRDAATDTDNPAAGDADEMDQTADHVGQDGGEEEEETDGEIDEEDAEEEDGEAEPDEDDVDGDEDMNRDDDDDDREEGEITPSPEPPDAAELVARFSPSVTTKPAPLPIKPASLPAKPPPVSTQHPTITQLPPVKTQPPPVAAQLPPAAAQSPPAAAQPSPAAAQPPPATAQPPPATAQPSPATTQPPPIIIETPPVTLEPLPMDLEPVPAFTKSTPQDFTSSISSALPPSANQINVEDVQANKSRSRSPELAAMATSKKSRSTSPQPPVTEAVSVGFDQIPNPEPLLESLPLPLLDAVSNDEQTVLSAPVPETSEMEPVIGEAVVKPVETESIIEETVVEAAAVGPIIEEPVVEQPKEENPASDQSMIEGPVIEEITVENPTDDQPVTEEPSIEKPVIEEPAIEPPTTGSPVDDSMIIDKPVPEESVTEAMIIEQPAPAVEPAKPEEEPIPTSPPPSSSISDAPITEPDPEPVETDPDAAEEKAADQQPEHESVAMTEATAAEPSNEASEPMVVGSEGADVYFPDGDVDLLGSLERDLERQSRDGADGGN